MERITRNIDRFTDIMAYIAGIIMCLGVALVVAEIIVRTFFHSTLYIATEYSGYFMVALTFLGFSYTLKEKGHIRMTFLLRVFKRGKIRFLIDLYTLIVGLVLFLIIAYITFSFFMNSVENATRSVQITRTYLAIPQFSMVLGSVLVVIQFISEILKRIIQFRHHDELLDDVEDVEANL